MPVQRTSNRSRRSSGQLMGVHAVQALSELADLRDALTAGDVVSGKPAARLICLLDALRQLINDRPTDLLMAITVLSAAGKPAGASNGNRARVAVVDTVDGPGQALYRVCLDHDLAECRTCEDSGFIPVRIVTQAGAAVEVVCPTQGDPDCGCLVCEWEHSGASVELAVAA